MRAVLVAVAMLALGGAMAPATSEEGRYQFGGDQLRVLDTKTGAIWVVKADDKGWYVMVPVLYESPDGPPTRTPPKPN